MLWLSWVDQCFPFCFLKLQLLCYILAGYLPFKQVQKPLFLRSIESLLPVGNSPVGLRACETPCLFFGYKVHQEVRISKCLYNEIGL